MDISALGKSKYLDRNFLLAGLTKIVDRMVLSHEQTVFTHSSVIKGGESSIRVFSFQLLPDFVALPIRGEASNIAAMLLEFSDSDARYGEATQRGAMKGWELREMEVDGKPVLTAQAIWI